jgi:hypothetical protein
MMADWLDDILDRGLPDNLQRVALPIRQHMAWLHAGHPGFSQLTIDYKRSLVAPCDDVIALNDMAITAARANLEGANISIRVGTLNKRPPSEWVRGDRAYNAAITALWADVDKPENAYRRVLGFNPPPSVILRTSPNSYHAYWFLSEPVQATEQVERVVKGIGLLLGGDTVGDTTRAMRCLGTFNNSQKPGRAGKRVVIARQPGIMGYPRYAFSAFLAYEYKEPPPPARHSLPQGVRASIPRWIMEHLQTPPTQGNRNNTLFSIAANLKDRGYSLQEIEALIPSQWAGLKDNEIRQTVRSGFKRPMRGIKPDRRVARARLKGLYDE